MMAGEVLWVCGWCGESLPRREPDPPAPPGMVDVPAGWFIMGASEGDEMAGDHERPCRRVHVSSYAIGRTPVRNDQYRAFVKAAGRPEPDHWKWHPPVGENGLHPVCFVTFHDAAAYCAWLSENMGRRYRLPTEAEWEKAARGGLWLDGDDTAAVPNPCPDRRFPHGEAELLPTQANFAGVRGGTTPVGRFPESAGPYGCLDLSGNVSEWCLDVHRPDAYTFLPQRNPRARGEGPRSLRGGSWRSGTDHVRCANRYQYDPERRSYGIGFRVVAPGEEKT